MQLAELTAVANAAAAAGLFDRAEGLAATAAGGLGRGNFGGEIVFVTTDCNNECSR